MVAWLAPGEFQPGAVYLVSSTCRVIRVWLSSHRKGRQLLGRGRLRTRGNFRQSLGGPGLSGHCSDRAMEQAVHSHPRWQTTDSWASCSAGAPLAPLSLLTCGLYVSACICVSTRVRAWSVHACVRDGPWFGITYCSLCCSSRASVLLPSWRASACGLDSL